MKRLNELLDFIGANKKIELIKALVLNVGIIAIVAIATILLKQIMIAFVGIIFILMANYILFNSYLSKRKDILSERESEFISIIGYFQFFVSNGFNVYQSFQSLIPYSSIWMEEQIQSLITQIDNDKSVKPFINFANKFTNKIANNVMLSIYQMVDEGENDVHLLNFQSLFDELKRNQQKDLIDGKDRSMSSLSSLPLIGAGAITVLLTFGIIFLMGEMINVL